MSKVNFGNDKCREIVENDCPYCNEHLLMNKRTFANHVRWCKANPKYEEIKASTRAKLLLFNQENPKIFEYTCKCVICGNEYQIKTSKKHFENKKYKQTCSDKCAKQLTVKNTNKEIRNNNIKKTFLTRESKTISKEPLIKICEYCGKEFTTYKKLQKCCCISCASHNRYKINDTQKLYKKLCAFNFALNSYPNEFDFDLINQYGWYKAKNHGDNPNGVSRDHCYSIDEGFKNLVDPYIISHPANCILIQQRKNASKHTKSNISIEDLIEKIKQWNEKYGEYENKIDYIGISNLGIKFNITI